MRRKLSGAENKRSTARENLTARGVRARLRLSAAEREFLDNLIARSGFINRIIMHLYMVVDVRGLDRWYLHIRRLRNKGIKDLELVSYWTLRVLERLSAIYIGGSLTAAEQRTFGLICRLEDYRLSRYNALIFGSMTGVMYLSSGNFANWLGEITGVFGGTLNLTSLLLYSIGALSVIVDFYRVVDSWLRKKAHMPFGIFPLVINSTTFLKRFSDLLRKQGH